MDDFNSDEIIVLLMILKKRVKLKYLKVFFQWIEYAFIRSFVAFLSTIPVTVSYIIGMQIGRVALMLLAERKSVVRSNLMVFQAWLKAKSNEDKSQLKDDFLDYATREVFLRSGGNILSSFSFAALPYEQRLKKVEFVGLDVLETAIAGNRGVVLLVAHMGPWEVIPSVISILIQNLGSQFGAIYRPLNNVFIENWYRSERENQGLRLFNRKEEFNQIFKFLKGGGVLGLLADQRVKTGEKSELFGEPAMTTPLVGLLSKRLDAPVVSLTLGYDQSCKLKMTFRRVNFEEAKTRFDYARVTNCELERMISTDVTGAFWLHRRFLI